MSILSFLDTTGIEDRRPLNKEETDLFFKCSFIHLKNPTELFSEEIAKQLGAMGLIFYKRLQWASPETQMSVPVAIFILSLAGGSPGNAVMWAYTVHKMYQIINRMVTFDDLIEAFPHGFPTESAYDRVWQSQKNYEARDGASDNFMDQLETWKN